MKSCRLLLNLNRRFALPNCCYEPNHKKMNFRPRSRRHTAFFTKVLAGREVVREAGHLNYSEA